MADSTKNGKAPAKPRKTAAKKSTAGEATKRPLKAEAKPSMVAEGEPSVAAETKAPASKPANFSKDEVARLAHQFWSERGHQHGKDAEDWFRAEQELRKRAS